jgi:hypothetical protein
MEHSALWEAERVPCRPAVDEDGFPVDQAGESLSIGLLDALVLIIEASEHMGQVGIAVRWGTPRDVHDRYRESCERVGEQLESQVNDLWGLTE